MLALGPIGILGPGKRSGLSRQGGTLSCQGPASQGLLGSESGSVQWLLHLRDWSRESFKCGNCPMSQAILLAGRLGQCGSHRQSCCKALLLPSSSCSKTHTWAKQGKEAAVKGESLRSDFPGLPHLWKLHAGLCRDKKGGRGFLLPRHLTACRALPFPELDLPLPALSASAQRVLEMGLL